MGVCACVCVVCDILGGSGRGERVGGVCVCVGVLGP
jgi:hypothetical protein